MSDQSNPFNPFEQAMSMTGIGGADPFAAATNPFAIPATATETPPPIDLGSHQTAANPFEDPQTPRATADAPTSVPTIVSMFAGDSSADDDGNDDDYDGSTDDDNTDDDDDDDDDINADNNGTVKEITGGTLNSIAAATVTADTAAQPTATTAVPTATTAEPTAAGANPAANPAATTPATTATTPEPTATNTGPTVNTAAATPATTATTATTPATTAEPDEIENPLAAAMDAQERKSLHAKPPIFEHGAAREPIADLDQTFEDLRVAKSDDFPELEDGARVTWDVTYGKVRKTVATPKKTKIGEFKKSIETSAEFANALKKDKDKAPDCIVKPRVTAQSKGDALLPPPAACAAANDDSPAPPGRPAERQKAEGERNLPCYKGVFASLEEAMASDKPISIVPGSDGKVYEIRREESGTFTTPSGECAGLSDIQPGFVPALPPIPRDRLLEIIAFFRSLALRGSSYEAIANIYWDRKRKTYVTSIPKQRVTATSADSVLTGEYCPERYIHYMDIHSHNVMPAAFSQRDDRDERATRLYAVVGRLDRHLPEMSLRMSNGGKYLAIDPGTVFESLDGIYPTSWNSSILHEASDGERRRADISGYLTRLELMCA